jgi:hypothetical protein
MDKDFQQTSFIPKKAIKEKKIVRAKKPIGLVGLVAWIVFFVSLLAAAGTYFYRAQLADGNISKDAQLAKAYVDLQPSLIADLQELDKRMKAADELLRKHVAISPIFDTLGQITLPSVRYNTFDYVIDEGGQVQVEMTGEASGFNSITVQSDLYDKNKDIKNPIFSNFTLDSAGNVTFDVTFSVDPALVRYESLLTRTGLSQ